MKGKDRSHLSDDDILSEVLGKPRQNLRHEIWLWLYLHIEKKLGLALHTCNGETMRDEIARAMRRQDYFYPPLAVEKDK